ncbi:LysR family transcriptional regulator [Microbacterium horticulturae]|uniref:LysR family transcriptional regulator n=1 Tax=Microbacterium horticulturae TaxID=3028316 RepID=A0ABY8BZW5_9MICO|nr:LysR family transcriptional regulator [Microbacterium sp. KACC 23027]WEG08535.1 LysR family transcriptional regulator [Microbacterium sp. KACC 23027]
MFELRRLRLLAELAQRGTIADVAARLSYSPSTVSQQLSVLEREAGVPLLEPDGRRVRLTPHGRLLAEHAVRVLELDEAAREALRSAQSGQVTVRIAAMATAAEALVPRALAELSASTPEIRVEMREMSPEEALVELAARSFDLVVAEQYPGHTRELHATVDRTLLGTDPVRLAVPAASTAMSIGDLADAAWIMEPAGTAVRQWAVQQCRQAGFEPDVRFEATDLGVHISMVASGQAVAILPDLVWTGDRHGVRSIDLPGSPVRELFAATRAASRGSEPIGRVRAALADMLAARRPAEG